MCGLFGYYATQKPIEENLVIQAMQLLQHRGPDQQGYWLSSDRKVALAQTRLSLNDLSKISLPLTNENRTIRVIANAEIYNHAILKKELLTKGHQFKTTCDIEVLPHLYEEYGINFINRLRGEFAFILWDDNQKALYAVRDRFGIKPLYYTAQEKEIYLSSELPTLLNLKVTKNQWDLAAIYDFMHLGLPYSKTLFSDIHQIPPAHYLKIQAGHLPQLHAYWDINYTSDSRINLATTTEAIREKLIESVTIRMKSDVPIGCYLSGGLDSSALLGIATKHTSQNMQAFSIGFEDKHVDESAIAERTANFAKANLNKLLVTEQDTVDHFQKVIQQTCFPVFNTAGVARYLLSQFTRERGYKAVLSGEGADEVFLGYWGAIITAADDPSIAQAFSLTPEARQALLQQLPMNRDANRLPAALLNLKTSLKHLPSWITTQAHFNARHREVLSSSMQQKFATYNPYTDLINTLNVQQKLDQVDHVQIYSYLWIKSFFPNIMLNWIGDRAEMAHGIEARQPFLDHELFELMAKIPTAMKIRNGTEKYLLREAARPYINDEIYQRKKFMFQAPPLRLTKESKLYQLITETILGNIDRVSFYDKAKVLAMLDLSRKADTLSMPERAELSYTLTSLASMLTLATHYQLSS